MVGAQRDERDGGTDTPGDGARAATPNPLDRRRRPALVALSVLLVVALAGAVVLWRSRGRAGTSERVRLEWTCANFIFWPMPDPAGGVGNEMVMGGAPGGGDDIWYAGHDPVTRGPIQTGQGPSWIDPPRRWADGTLRFDTDDTATFVSDAGGTMAMRREPPGPRFYRTDCAFGSLR